MKIAITGHRPNKLGNDYDLKSPLIKSIELEIMRFLAKMNYSTAQEFTFISGMALGIDTLFAKMAIELEYPFIAAIPCNNHESKWPQKSKDTYNELLSKAQEVVKVTTDDYTPYCMQKRNEWMVDNCDLLIAVWDGTPGGTANCVNYAKSKGKFIFYINPAELSNNNIK